MSFHPHINGSIPLSDSWSGYLNQAQSHILSNSRIPLLVLIIAPVIAILLNALWQLVRAST
jgi:sterol 14-demethylase